MITLSDCLAGFVVKYVRKRYQLQINFDNWYVPSIRVGGVLLKNSTLTLLWKLPQKQTPQLLTSYTLIRYAPLQMWKVRMCTKVRIFTKMVTHSHWDKQTTQLGRTPSVIESLLFFFVLPHSSSFFITIALVIVCKMDSRKQAAPDLHG